MESEFGTIELIRATLRLEDGVSARQRMGGIYKGVNTRSMSVERDGCVYDISASGASEEAWDSNGPVSGVISLITSEREDEQRLI